jgi:hypothetical protein
MQHMAFALLLLLGVALVAADPVTISVAATLGGLGGPTNTELDSGYLVNLFSHDGGATDVQLYVAFSEPVLLQEDWFTLSPSESMPVANFTVTLLDSVEAGSLKFGIAWTPKQGVTYRGRVMSFLVVSAETDQNPAADLFLRVMPVGVQAW